MRNLLKSGIAAVVALSTVLWLTAPAKAEIITERRIEIEEIGQPMYAHQTVFLPASDGIGTHVTFVQTMPTLSGPSMFVSTDMINGEPVVVDTAQPVVVALPVALNGARMVPIRVTTSVRHRHNTLGIIHGSHWVTTTETQWVPVDALQTTAYAVIQ